MTTTIAEFYETWLADKVDLGKRVTENYLGNFEVYEPGRIMTMREANAVLLYSTSPQAQATRLCAEFDELLQEMDEHGNSVIYTRS